VTAPDERKTVELTHADVTSILDLIERSNVEYLEVEVGGTRIIADRTGTTVAARAPAPAAPVPAPALASPPAPAPVPAPVAAAPPPAPAAPVADDSVVVPAPMVGVFYRAPEPGAPAFVEAGSRVEQGATMGLVEVMKMFNSVTAPVSGEVVEVLAGNDEFVEFGQPLFRLNPA
jgi:acetyl-CoA carboxylase biotin carboxyl carrier protein